MKKTTIYFVLILGLGALFTSCEKDDPDTGNEEEIITTLDYKLLGSNGDEVTLNFTDLDGDGGDAPTITGGTLKANTSYSGTLDFLNESETPAEVITDEVREEGLEHQCFFESTLPGLSVAYRDSDSEGNPLGLETTLTTGDAGSGTLTITLRHEPNKTAAGVKDGDKSNAGGETDIEVTFTIDVE